MSHGPHWTLTVEFDYQRDLEEVHPELVARGGECRLVIDRLLTEWKETEENLAEYADWHFGWLCVHMHDLGPLNNALAWILANTVPRGVSLRRNGSR
jgi:hypothetical protein